MPERHWSQVPAADKTQLRMSPGANRMRAVPPVDEPDLETRVRTLTLEQKIRLLTGADFWSLHAEPTVGLRRMVLSDGPAGVRGERWDERDSSANIPSPTAVAATWDEQLAEQLGGLLASEARRKGVDVLLAPTLNLHRTPYGGRHFECFSEDPLLTARIGVALIRGVQAGGVAATAKHFIANDSETDRMRLDAHVDERALRELYLAPFEAAIRDGCVWLVMAAYNGVNGHSMTESPLLRDLLADELGFDGVVVSDWFATRCTEASARAGLDLVMPGPDGPWGRALLQAVRSGAVPEAIIDDKVLRLLRLAERVRALGVSAPAPAPPYEEHAIASLLRRAAAASFVLARNPSGLLPLEQPSLRRVAVIGPNAAAARTIGGGSATVFAPYTVSPLDGLRAALEPRGVTVEHCIGVLATDRIPAARAPWLRTPGGEPGVEVRFVGADGELLSSERRTLCAFNWSRSLDYGAQLARVEVHTVIRASDPGTYTVAASGVGRYRLTVGGRVVFDGRLDPAPGSDIVQNLMIPPQTRHDITLAADEEVPVVLAHEVGSAAAVLGDVGLSFQLNLRPPHGSDDEEIERAVALARSCDVAIVVVGTTEEVESEGFDRSSLALPGRQDELVRRVAAANRNTIAVVNAGAPVLMPWVDEVAAILLVWFPGQEFGSALADVVLGHAEPGGRLPTSWPASEAGLPSPIPVDGTLFYIEGLSVGYRAAGIDRPPARFPFGHGSGYSTWSYEAIDAPHDVRPGATVEVVVRLRNTGKRRSREVVQLYASRPDSAIARPGHWLIGFAPVDAEPGAEAAVAVTVAPRAFEHWDVTDVGWTVEPGPFVLEAGGSSAATPLRTELTITTDGARHAAQPLGEPAR